MAENDTTPPVTISIVGTGTGDGGGMAPTPNGTIATTPGTQPNLLINVISPVLAVVIRAVNLFLTTFVGLLTAAGIGVGSSVLGTDFRTVVMQCASVALVTAGIGTIKNIITVFGRLEGKYPLATGTI